METNEAFALLSSHLKLDREKGVQQLELCVMNGGERFREDVCCQLMSMLQDNCLQWESRHGALLGLQCLLPRLLLDNGEEQLVTIRLSCLRLLTDAEVRVRLAAGDVLGALCKHRGPQIYVDCRDVVVDLIQTSLERQYMEDSATAQVELEEMEKLMEKFSSTSEKRRMSAEDIFHDTAGWKSLETSMKALQAMVDGCGNGFLPFINEELLNLIFQVLVHTNRFVRETGFYVCSSLVNCGLQKCDVTGATGDVMKDPNPLFEYGHQFSKYLGKGMSDNWSQVRLASSVATRNFLLALPDDSSREVFFSELLPKMCLNRYYLADGVRLYSQETWRLVAGEKGRQLVEKYIKDVIQFYEKQTQANNHAVREASCSCIAELAVKIPRDAVKPYLDELFKTLLICFEDDSWPVRDAACLACGNFVTCFPKECRPSFDKLIQLFFMNLEDNITSVRQGAAAALANVFKAYGDMGLTARLRDGLKAVENQPSESQKYGDLDKGPATFGVAKRLRDNDIELHTDQTMYSCGSLAPKMGRGRLGGCLDRTFRRPPQPWELTDGCIFLLSELSAIPSATPHVLPVLPLVVNACSKRHYTHHVVLLETMCKQLPQIAKGIGKNKFKPYLELFLEPVFYSLSSENALTSAAASQCLVDLSHFLGHGIMRGRIELYDPSLLIPFDATIASAFQY